MKFEFKELRKKASFDHSKNSQQINSIASQHKSAQELKNHKVRGFTYYNLKSGLSLSFSVRKYTDKTHCIYISKAKFIIGYDAMNVFIDKKYAKNGCAYKVILDHENTHVSISNNILTRFIPSMKKELKRAVESIPVRKNYDPDVIMARMKNKLMVKMKHLVGGLSRALRTEHAKIDTIESYQKVRSSCTDW